LISRFWVFGEEGISTRDNDEDEEDESEDCIDNKPNYAEDTVCETWKTENVGEEYHEEHIEGIDCGNGNGETVGLFIHVWTDPAEKAEENAFKNEYCDDLKVRKRI